MSSIIFGGLKTKNNIDYIVFINSENVSVEIPIEKVSADRIEKYLSRICPPPINDTIFAEKPVGCAICMENFVNGEDIETTTILNKDGSKEYTYVHSDCLSEE